MQKYSLSIQGHRTSISLEPVFWAALQRAAKEDALPLAQLVASIDAKRSTGLASALRVYLFERYCLPAVKSIVR